MREIKFRAWDIKSKKYVSNQRDISITLDGKVLEQIGEFDYDEITDVVNLEQYTGLKDKNGVEIYEGDIVIDELGGKASVIFDKIGYDGSWNGLTGFALTNWIEDDNCEPNTTYRELWHGFDARECEVIGNIHEEVKK